MPPLLRGSDMATCGAVVSFGLALKEFVEAAMLEPGETLDEEDKKYVAGRTAECVPRLRACCIVRLVEEVLNLFRKNHLKKPSQLASLTVEHVSAEAPLVGGV